MALLSNFKSIYEYMVEKFGNKDFVKIHFIKQMELRQKSIMTLDMIFQSRGYDAAQIPKSLDDTIYSSKAS